MTLARSDSERAVGAVARHALAAGREGGEVSPAAVDAVVFGTGDPAALAGAGSLELVLFDTDRIGGFVFESSRLPVLAGASALLRRLQEEIAAELAPWVVFSRGGEGLLLAPPGRGAELCADIETRYQRQTAGALGVTTAWLAAEVSDFVAPAGRSAEPAAQGGLRLVTGTAALLARLRDEVRFNKAARWPAAEPVPGGSPRCVSCRDRAGAAELPVSRYRPDERGLLCAPCDLRWQAGREEIAGLSFEHLAAAGAGAGLGFLYADGNGLGRRFADLSSLADLHLLSSGVAEAFATVRAQVQAQVAARVGGKPVPVLSLLAGGDEGVWILPADLAVEVAGQLPGLLHAASTSGPDLAALLGPDGITAGIGLVLCDAGYPVRYQYQLACALQRNAKEVGQRRGGGSVLDFELLAGGTPLSHSLELARRLAYASEDAGFLRTCRPYQAADFSRLCRTVRAARQAGLGRSQLFALDQGAAGGRRLFLNHLGYQIARQRGPYLRWLEAEGVDLGVAGELERFFVRPLEEMPQDDAVTDSSAEAGSWRMAARNGTWIADALQLWPLLAEQPAAGQPIAGGGEA